MPRIENDIKLDFKVSYARKNCRVYALARQCWRHIFDIQIVRCLIWKGHTNRSWILSGAVSWFPWELIVYRTSKSYHVQPYFGFQILWMISRAMTDNFDNANRRTFTAYTYQDVLIRPKRSTLKSRSQVELERTYQFKHSKLEWTGVPIMAANMWAEKNTSCFPLIDSWRRWSDKVYHRYYARYHITNSHIEENCFSSFYWIG